MRIPRCGIPHDPPTQHCKDCDRVYRQAKRQSVRNRQARERTGRQDRLAYALANNPFVEAYREAKQSAAARGVPVLRRREA